VANSSQIGAIHVEASINSGKFVDGAKKIKAAAKDTEVGVKKSFGGMQKAVGSGLGALKAGAAGFVAALSVGMFTQVIGNALKYAASLKTVSERLGVTTKDLQTLRYAAQQNGIANEVLDNGLEKLAITLGKVAAGAREPTKALQAIGITADQLKGKDTGEALRIIADGLKNIGDRSQRAAVEVALFGETGAKLDALLSKGASGINELAAAAEELGIVLSDEQIQKADETAKKMEALKTVLQARIAGVVADNADAILGLANALSDFVGAISTAVNAWRQMRAEFNAGFYEMVGMEQAAAKWRGSNYQSGRTPSVAGSAVTVKLGPAKPVVTTGTGSIGKFLAPSGGGRKRTPRAPKDTSLRDAFQFESEMRRAEMDVLRALQSLSTDYIERGAISLQMLDLERRAYQEELKYEVASKGKTQAQADQLQAEYDKKDALERTAILADREAQRYEDSARLDDVTLELERDRLESEGQLTRSAKEERDIRLRLLDLYYRQEKARLEAVIADEQASFAAKEEARRRLANLGQTYANDRQGVLNSTQGPLESFFGQIPQNAQEAAEWMEHLKVQGIEGAIDSIMALTQGFESFADVAKNAIQGVIAELLRMQLMKFAMSLFGGASGGTSGAAFFGGGADLSFASGGAFTIQGRPGIDKNLLSINGLPIANVSHGERVNVSNDNSSSGRGGMSINMPITINGPADRRSIAQIESGVRRAVGNATRRGTA
jgi:hypothetical protein